MIRVDYPDLQNPAQSAAQSKNPYLANPNPAQSAAQSKYGYFDNPNSKIQVTNKSALNGFEGEVYDDDEL